MVLHTSVCYAYILSRKISVVLLNKRHPCYTRMGNLIQSIQQKLASLFDVNNIYRKVSLPPREDDGYEPRFRTTHTTNYTSLQAHCVYDIQYEQGMPSFCPLRTVRTVSIRTLNDTEQIAVSLRTTTDTEVLAVPLTLILKWSMHSRFKLITFTYIHHTHVGLLQISFSNTVEDANDFLKYLHVEATRAADKSEIEHMIELSDEKTKDVHDLENMQYLLTDTAGVCIPWKYG